MFLTYIMKQLSSYEIKSVILYRILDVPLCILLLTNDLGKGTNTFIPAVPV